MEELNFISNYLTNFYSHVCFHFDFIVFSENYFNTLSDYAINWSIFIHFTQWKNVVTYNVKEKFKLAHLINWVCA